MDIPLGSEHHVTAHSRRKESIPAPLDSRTRTLSEDSADDEAFTCLDPFEHNWDEPALGLDDPA